MLEKYRSIVCWLNLWLGFSLIGSARIYSLIHQVTFMTMENGMMDIYFPDPTVALLVSMGITLLVMSNFYLIFHFIHVAIIICSRKAIRI